MANISDAFGDVIVEGVGQELKEFLEVVQKDAWYLLFDSVDSITPDGDGNVSFSFSSGGRWAYDNNLRGYLEGEWMNGEVEKKAYKKFIRAFKKKDGLISVSYSDSDTAMDWMGSGEYNMSMCDGEIMYDHDFEEKNITLEGFADMHGEDTYWAMCYIYGDEVGDLYNEYVAKEEKNGRMPARPELWYSLIYEEQ